MKSAFISLVMGMILTFPTHGMTAHFLKNGTLVIVDGGHRVRISNVSEGVEFVPTAPYVHAIQKRNGEYFVVLTRSEWTRGYPPRGGAGGAGGCGEEACVQWLQIVDGGAGQKS
jgi:hypothetical protein